MAIAFAPIFVRLSELGPVATAFYRTAFAWLPLWLWYRRSPAVADAEPATWHLCLPGIFFALDLAAWHWSIKLTTVANATLLANLAPVFVTLGAYLLFGDRFSTRFVTGLVTAVAGLVLLSGASLARDPRHVAGDMLGIATAIFYGAYLLSVSRLRRRHATSQLMQWSSLTAAAVLLPLAWLSGEALLIETVNGLVILLALAWIAHVGGQGLIAHSLAHLPAAYSSLVLVIQPICAAGLAWLWFDETLTAMQLTGAMVILIGIILASRSNT